MQGDIVKSSASTLIELRCFFCDRPTSLIEAIPVCVGTIGANALLCTDCNITQNMKESLWKKRGVGGIESFGTYGENVTVESITYLQHIREMRNKYKTRAQHDREIVSELDSVVERKTGTSQSTIVSL